MSDASSNGSCYISGDLADWLQDQQVDHTPGAACHPQTQGKTGRWRKTLNNRIPLDYYYFPGKLWRQIKASERAARDVGSLRLSVEGLAVERLY